MRNKSIFARRLSEARRAKGWSQWEFSEMLGVNHMTLVRWENDYYLPKIDKLVEIVKLLDVSADWLLGGD